MAATTQFKATCLFDQALQTFGETLKAGVKVQEEAAKWWTDALERQDAVRDWQIRSRDFVKEFVPSAQKSAADCLKLVEKNSQKSIALLKRALDSEADTEDLRKKSAADCLKLVEKNSQKSIALLKRAIESEADTEDLRKKTEELWEASLSLVRENAQAVTENNLKLIELWSRLLKKGAENGSGSKAK